MPPELLDGTDPVWMSKPATVAWLRRHGLSVSGPELEWGPLNRHKESADRWAKAAGLVKPPLANGWVGPDYVRMRELGLPSDSGKCSLERMLAAGVRIED